MSAITISIASAPARARARATTTTTTMRAKMNLRACSTPSGATREARAMKIIARAGEEEGETVETEEEVPEVEVVEDDEEVAGGAEEEETALSALVGRLEVVVGDNADAAELVASLKGEIGDANAKMVGMEDQVAAMKDQYLRLNADFDNFRKRTLKEKENLASSAKGDFVKALLPVLDNFDLAEKNIKGSTEGEEKILTGYQNMHKQLMEILSSQGLQVVAGVGEPFDPNDHEAIMREENDEMDEDTIIEEFRKGYKIGSSLIRASMVKVSTKP
ncbi:chloroplast GrpE-like protein [Ostreococcus lucimarinus CCE9901]|uniref:GrpE protein homolog n=1 Tax=Ostreococcus lucimarinus (strain CCE9901) TaxID=436017 RepID=A4S1H6_OSTLU|nr:chloroplast GrpE-like protein [Ostreococcus lucimarinus CCE9901]ABO97662.1 chloroplast GrpE-like protein [Ostreococcus lucimarinus CCE9901]|eukprot:XP_001419369.1 chloroplast GrpE-like protein [Ostreococcus lucimarinus CCE9901]